MKQYSVQILEKPTSLCMIVYPQSPTHQHIVDVGEQSTSVFIHRLFYQEQNSSVHGFFPTSREVFSKIRPSHHGSSEEASGQIKTMRCSCSHVSMGGYVLQAGPFRDGRRYATRKVLSRLDTLDQGMHGPQARLWHPVRSLTTFNVR